ncbi:uncharacterized protein LOC135709918 [Ochlerotatus camptorhynchus]|uniref:uncharacterized protein LOC135709918 n=1 Tax=Ochlerotatus camptorhynchus TaxID=644619 RepID=UPI0031E43339
MYSQYITIVLILAVGFTSSATITRVKRQQFTPLESCTVSHQEIEELIRLTKNLNAAIESVQVDIRSGFDEEAANRDQCSRQLGQFRGTVKNVIQGYKTIDRNTMSQAQYDRAKARYQGDIQRLLRKIDNLKRDVEDSYRGEVDKLRSNMQEFKSQLDDNLSLLEQERARSRSAFVRLCIANVRARRIKDAVEDFQTLSDRPYEPIVTDVYENEPQNADLVMDFLEAIDLYYEPISGYQVLYQHMNRNNQLGGPSGRRLLLHLMALSTADDENSRRAQKLLSEFKSDVH